MWVGRARDLRQRETPAERRLWYFLRGNRLGVKFRRQHPIPPYIVDFVVPRLRVIVEVDGRYHDDPVQHARDAARTAALGAAGYTIVRVTNDEVVVHTSRAIQRIVAHIEHQGLPVQSQLTWAAHAAYRAALLRGHLGAIPPKRPRLTGPYSG